MTYTAVDLNPTQGQMSDLSEGNAVKLSTNHLHGDVTFHLTKAQLASLAKAKVSGRGFTLKLSRAQVDYHVQRGEGLFSDIARGAWGAVKSGAKAAAKAGANYAINKGTEYAKGAAQNLAGKATDFASSKIKDLLGLHGSGLKAEHRNTLLQIHQQHGEGFFGSLLKGLAHHGVDAVASLLGGGLTHPLSDTHKRHVHEMMHQHGTGFFGSLLGGLSSLLGGGIVPHHQPEAFWQTLNQKKVPVRELGAGLYYN